jgi:hypothetical protein
LPVSPGRNLSTLVETAVRVHLLRVRGYDAAHTFVARHAALIEASEGAAEVVPDATVSRSRASSGGGGGEDE